MGCRAGSKSSGRANRAASRFALPRIRITGSPRRIACPFHATSSAAQRLSARSTEPSKRSSSSTAAGSPDGSVARASRSSGLRDSCSTPLAIRLTVVSCPATISSTSVLDSSSALRRSPSRSAATRAEIRSSRGSTRRVSNSASRYVTKAVSRRPVSSAASAVIGGSSSALPQARKRSRSSMGTPSSSKITVVGSGYENSVIRSTGPPSAAARATSPSASSAAIASTRGRRSATGLGVKPWLTRSRSLRWSAPSWFNMWRPIRRSSSLHGARSSGGAASASSRTKRLSRSIASTSA